MSHSTYSPKPYEKDKYYTGISGNTFKIETVNCNTTATNYLDNISQKTVLIKYSVTIHITMSSAYLVPGDLFYIWPIIEEDTDETKYRYANESFIPLWQEKTQTLHNNNNLILVTCNYSIPYGEFKTSFDVVIRPFGETGDDFSEYLDPRTLSICFSTAKPNEIFNEHTKLVEGIQRLNINSIKTDTSNIYMLKSNIAPYVNTEFLTTIQNVKLQHAKINDILFPNSSKYILSDKKTCFIHFFNPTVNETADVEITPKLVIVDRNRKWVQNDMLPPEIFRLTNDDTGKTKTSKKVEYDPPAGLIISKISLTSNGKEWSSPINPDIAINTVPNILNLDYTPRERGASATSFSLTACDRDNEYFNTKSGPCGTDPTHKIELWAAIDKCADLTNNPDSKKVYTQSEDWDTSTQTICFDKTALGKSLAIGKTLHVKVCDGLTWGNEITITNTNEGKPDPPPPPTKYKQVKVYDNGTWKVQKAIKVYNGTNWVAAKAVKVYDGSEWKNVKEKE